MKNIRNYFLLAGLLCAYSLAGAPASAQTKIWGSSGTLLSGTGQFRGSPGQIKTIPDQAGGQYVIWWEGSPSFSPLYALRLNAAGDPAPAWNPSADNAPVVISSKCANEPFSVWPDGSGGFVVSWSTRSSDDSGEAFAQRYNSAGAEQWTSGTGDGSTQAAHAVLLPAAGSDPFYVVGGYGYFIAMEAAPTIKKMNLSDASITSAGVIYPHVANFDDINTATFLPSFSAVDPGVLLVLQGKFTDIDPDRNNLKAWRVGAGGFSIGWDPNTDGAGVTITVSGTIGLLCSGDGCKGSLRGTYDAQGNDYLVWFDTRTSGGDTGIYGMKIAGAALPALPASGHLLVSDGGALASQMEDEHMAASAGKLGLYWDVSGAGRAFQIADTSDWSTKYGSAGRDIGGSGLVYVAVSTTSGDFLLDWSNGTDNLMQVFSPSGTALYSSTPSYASGGNLTWATGLGDNFSLTYVDASNHLYANLLSTAVPPLAAVSVTPAVSDAYTIGLSWTDPNGLADTVYTLQLSPDSDYARIIFSKDITGVSYQFNGLLPGTHYYFRVKAVKGQRSSPFAQADAATPAGPGFTNAFIGNWTTALGGRLPDVVAVSSEASPYAFLIPADGNNTYAVWLNFDFGTNLNSVSALKLGADGTPVAGWPRTVLSGIPQASDGKGISLAAASDGLGGFVVAYSSQTLGYATGMDAAGNFRFQNARFHKSASIIGFLPEIRVAGGKGYFFFVDPSGNSFMQAMNLSNGTILGSDADMSYHISDFDTLVVKTASSPANGSYGDGVLLLLGSTTDGVAVRRINSSGVTDWTSALLSEVTNLYGEQKFIPDGSGGAYIVWQDGQGTPTLADDTLRIFRVKNDGTKYNSYYPRTLTSGRPLYAPYENTYFDAAITSHGPVITFIDTNTADILLERLLFKPGSDSGNGIQWSATDLLPASGFEETSLACNGRSDVCAFAVSRQFDGLTELRAAEFRAGTGALAVALAPVLSNMPRPDGELSRQGAIVAESGTGFALGAAIPHSLFVQQISTFAVLQQPSSLGLSHTTDREIDLSWDQADSSITAWSVQYSTSADFYAAVSTQVTAPEKSFKFDGTHLVDVLAPNTTYFFRVQASSGPSVSPFSGAASTSTLLSSTAPVFGAPSIVMADSLFAEWTDSNPVHTMFELRISTDPGFAVAVSTTIRYTLPDEARRFPFFDLLGNTTYYIGGRAIGNNGDIVNFSSDVVVRTGFFGAAADPDPYVNITSSSIKVKWTQGNNGTPTGYIAKVCDKADCSGYSYTASTTTNLYQVFGTGGEGTLAPNTTYYFRVSATRDEITLSPALIGSTSTAPGLPAVPTVTQGSVLSGSFTCQWTSANGPIVQYIVQRSTAQDFSGSVITSTALAGQSYQFTGLTPNLQYYARVKAVGNFGRETAFTAAVSTITKPVPPGAAGDPFALVEPDAVVVRWTSGANGGALAYAAEVSRRSDFSVVAASSLTLNTMAAFGNGGVGAALSPNTSYYFRVSVSTNGSQSSYLTIGSTYTLANAPVSFTQTAVYYSSAAFTWGPNGNPAGTAYSVLFSSPGGSTGYQAVTDTAAVITGLLQGTTYTVSVVALNGTSRQTTPLALGANVVTLVHLSESGMVNASGGVLNFSPANGDITIDVPAGAFASPVTLVLVSPSTFPVSTASNLLGLSGTNVGLEITPDQNVQPSKPVEIVIGYSGDASITAADEGRLIVARYDPATGLWTPLQTMVDRVTKRVTAYTTHFSLFRVMIAAVSGTVSTVKVAPNPLRPSKGAAYASMTFSSIPAGATLQIFNLTGEKVRALTADAAGVAVWDGKNDSGSPAASGVYFVYIKADGGGKKTIKVAVQR